MTASAVIFSRPKDAHAAGMHVGRRDEKLQIVIGAQRVEIDEALDQILQRIDVERIDVVGREIARNRVEPGLHGRAFERRERQQPFHHGALSAGRLPRARCRPPKIGKPFLRLFASAAGETVGQHHGVDGSRRGAGNALDDKPLVAQKLFEHAPGEGAMRAAALQREIDALDRRRGSFVLPRVRARIAERMFFMPKVSCASC